MSSEQSKKIGGEYGKIRANIDVDRLNAYLSKHVPDVKAPVEVKQFKVRRLAARFRLFLTSIIVWTGGSSSSQSTLACLQPALQSNPTYFLTDKRCATSLSSVLETYGSPAALVLCYEKSLLANSFPKLRIK